MYLITRVKNKGISILEHQCEAISEPAFLFRGISCGVSKTQC